METNNYKSIIEEFEEWLGKTRHDTLKDGFPPHSKQVANWWLNKYTELLTSLSEEIGKGKKPIFDVEEVITYDDEMYEIKKKNFNRGLSSAQEVVKKYLSDRVIEEKLK